MYGHTVRNRSRKRPKPHTDRVAGSWSRGPRSWVVTGGAAVLLGAAAGHAVFRAGYVLQVDTVWGPHAPPLQLGFYAPIGLTQQAAIAVFGGALVGKAYVLGVLTLCAFAPMVALRKFPLWIRVLCGAIGVFNPWVYERIVEGQWIVAAAGASLFLWLAAFEHLEGQPSAAAAVLVAASSLLVIALSPGFAVMLAILVAVRVMLRARRPARRDAVHASALAQRRWSRAALLLTAVPVLAAALQIRLRSGRRVVSACTNLRNCRPEVLSSRRLAVRAPCAPGRALGPVGRANRALRTARCPLSVVAGRGVRARRNDVRGRLAEPRADLGARRRARRSDDRARRP